LIPFLTELQKKKNLLLPGIQNDEQDSAVNILQLSIEVRQAVPVLGS
jgi:hypothetical protein